ncbi:hypothetical protein [Vibrio phage vB_VpM-pA2SJ1]|uniref:Uncharacterized protein n=1 Tax=Vibrio phage vB_VpM-pA2SJ1 TaxID=3095964 RepID=A0AAX4J5D7_9CAUD
MSKYITLPGMPLGVGYSHCVVTEPSKDQRDNGYEFGSVLCSCPNEENADQIAKAMNLANSQRMTIGISVTDIDAFKGLVDALAANSDQLPEPVVNELNKLLAGDE